MIKYLFISLILFNSLFAESTYEEAYALYKQDKFQKSLEMFEELVAVDSDYDAAYILGYMYEHGEGCSVNIEKSQVYYKIAAHGYYFEQKPDPIRSSQKTQKRLYNTIQKPADEITKETIAQYTQSLYNIKAHNANYFLPVSYKYGSGYPEPTDSAHEVSQIETEFQFSLKYDFATNILGLDEIYTMAYTQISFWQLYVNSAYFRESNYNPEFFVTVPVSYFLYLKGVKLGFAHQSNGQGLAAERSWNYIGAQFYFQTGFFFTKLHLYKDVGDLIYNPDLMDYMGYGEIEFILPYKKHILSLKSRNSFSKYRATQVDYSYPFFNSKDLFLYVKAFTGYGESLIDYNHEVHKIGIGFSISR